jgi:OpgC protein
MDALQSNDLMRSLVYDKPGVAFGRLVVCVVLGIVAFSLMTLAWQPVRRATSWLLLPLGQNALAAYSLHIFVVALTTKLTLEVYGSDTPVRLYSTAVQVAGVLVVWAALFVEPRLRTQLGGSLGNHMPRLPLRRVVSSRPTSIDRGGI